MRRPRDTPPAWTGDAVTHGKYRYQLSRTWDKGLPVLGFIMLNPSTADAIENDPTIKRCMVRARQLQYGGLVVVNLFAYRSTDRSILRKLARDVAIGPQNDAQILAGLTGCRRVIAGWGNDGTIHARHGEVVRMLDAANIQLHALRISRDGHPGHPLYLPYKLRLIPYPRRRT